MSNQERTVCTIDMCELSVRMIEAYSGKPRPWKDPKECLIALNDGNPAQAKAWAFASLTAVDFILQALKAQDVSVRMSNISSGLEEDARKKGMN